ncbi:MAG: LysM peptidoglycan-binding domain-containing protein, partial [Oscillospiraceae bacterium]|nr:LysM peptidoglycan-binding domain-containing protein [Oscillospiraceae bacterium]
MDQELKLTEFSCCEPLKRQVLTSEETVEFSLGDYCADIGRIISWHTEPAVYGKRVREGGFEVMGAVSVTVLYVGMDGDGLRSCCIKVPFTMRREEKEGLCFVEAEAYCESCECRLVNARKILCRCRAAVSVLPYGEKKLRFCPEFTAPADLGIRQLCKKTDGVYLAQLWEKEFPFTDSVPLRQGRADEVLFSRLTPRVTECRVCGAKVMVKGEVALFALCRGEEGGYLTVRGEMPFAQLTELPCEGENTEFEAAACLKDHALALVLDGGAQLLEAQMTVLLTLRARKPCRETYVADLYGIRCEAEAQREMMTLAESERCFSKKQTLQVKAPAGLAPRSILWAEGVCGAVETVKEENAHALRTLVTVKAVYLDETDAPALAQGSAECRLRLETGEGSALYGETVTVTEVTAAVGEDGMDCRAEVEFAFGHRLLRHVGAVVGVKTSPLQEEKERPSVAVRRVEEGDTLWQLAKTHRTAVEAIEKANGGSME